MIIIFKRIKDKIHLSEGSYPVTVRCGFLLKRCDRFPWLFITRAAEIVPDEPIPVTSPEDAIKGYRCLATTPKIALLRLETNICEERRLFQKQRLSLVQNKDINGEEFERLKDVVKNLLAHKENTFQG